MDSFRKIDDEPFPSFLSSASLGSSGRATLGNVTLGSTLGVPVAASTVAKIRATADNRVKDIQASYLEDEQFSLTCSQASNGEREKFALSFKDDLANAEDFLTANRLSDLLVKVNLDETESMFRSKVPTAEPPFQTTPVPPRPSGFPDDLSTGLLTLSHIAGKDMTAVKNASLPATVEEESPASEGADSDRYSDSVSSFLANEKLMSLDSMNSEATDDDIDVDHLHDDDLELYFNKLVPPAIQRGRVEGQEIPDEEQPGTQANSSHPSSTEPDKNRYSFLDDYDQGDFHMPDVRLAATGMDSCPASDEEDTEDELDTATQNHTGRAQFLLPSTSRHLVGESHQPNFRPGLEGGSSEDESQSRARYPSSTTGIEHRRSAEGQVINSPITGDGGGGDGSSGSEEDGNDGGVSTLPLPPTGVPTTYDVLRGLGIVGASGEGADELLSLPGLSRAGVPGHSEMGDRVGPVGTGEAVTAAAGSGPANPSSVNWSMSLDRQEALNAMDSTESAAGSADALLDSVYLRTGSGQQVPQDVSTSVALLQGTQSSFHLSHVLHDPHTDEEEGDRGRTRDLGLRGGPCGDSAAPQEPSDSNSDEDPQGPSLELKYLSKSFHEEEGELNDEGWNHRPESLELELQQGANATHSVVYQDEQGKWVTDLAYYSSFEREMETNVPDDVANQFQAEDFVSGDNAIEKIIEDQEEFEKEHQFIQEEQIEAANTSVGLGDTSWKLPASGHVLLRASQISSGFEKGNQSYLRLSLGEFFGQRSEALGCLGSADDRVKRPSFGYIITSPEKREPFPLIRPSDFSSRESSIHNGTVQQTDADETMSPEDLDRTLEPVVNGVPPSEEAQPHAHEKENAKNPSVWSPEDKESSGQSTDSPNGSGNQLLSISTIASAIADASISSDPAQLAAMIMELSKKRRAKGHQNAGKHQVQNPHPDQDPVTDQASLLEALQKTISLGDRSALDMEKYLKRTEVSSSDSEVSGTQSCFDISSWVDNLANSHGLSQERSSLVENRSVPCAERRPVTETQPTTVQNSEASPGEPTKVKTEASAQRSDAKRSGIPRPRSSSIPTASAQPSRRSVGAGQPSSVKLKTAENVSEPAKTKTSELRASAAAANKSGAEAKVKLGAVRPQVSKATAGARRSLKANESISAPAVSPKNSSSSPRAGRSDLPNLRGSPHTPKHRSAGGGRGDTSSAGDRIRSARSPGASPTAVKEKHKGQTGQGPPQTSQGRFGSPDHSAPAGVEDTRCTFRPSTSPLTHSSPSQSSLPSGYGEGSPSSSGGVADGSPHGEPLSPQSHCSSPTLSRLTYLSMNESSVVPTPDRHKKNTSMALSTTIIRASPTPPVELCDQKEGGPGLQQNPNDVLGSATSAEPPPRSKTPQLTKQNSDVVGPRSQSECNFHKDFANVEYGHGKRHSEPDRRLYPPGDSGYSSNLNIQHQQQPSGAVDQAAQQWPNVSAAPNEHVPGSRYGLPPPSYSAEELRYGPVPNNYSSQGALLDLAGGVPTLLTGRSLFGSQLAQQYLGPDVPLHAGSYHVAAPSGGLFGVPAAVPGTNPPIGHLQAPGPGSLTAGYLNGVPLQHPHQYPIGKPYNQLNLGTWTARDLVDIQTQVVVPEELKFPSACCVGIASQTSLSIFNPSERWQQVAINVTSLSIDGEKVDTVPYQWLMVKNKTIIGPKSTEEQKVLFIAPRAGLYQCTLSVSSWPASAEPESVARAEVFAKKVVLIAVAESPSVEVDVGKSGCLNFGDLAGGSAKALPLKLVNRTRATVPIRLVISSNASAWHCFSFSKSPVAMTAEGSLLTGGAVTPVSAPSVINHVLHASYGDKPDTFMVWVHFHAPQKYISASGELGPADEYSARVDIEVDSPGPSHVIRSVALRARSGTARVHAPKDLQTVCLQAPFGLTVQQTLPLKNAGNIDVQLRLKSTDSNDCFSVKPDELSLRAGEEQGVVVSFTAQGSRKHRESLLTILVLPSGPQYEVVLKGQVVQENSGKVAPTPAIVSHADVPPILSNKQFMAWGGVTLGRAVQQKLVLRNNSPTAAQQLRLLIRGQDQDCFQLQSSFGPEERLTRHRELSIRPKEDVTIHLLFAPTRVACMLAKLEIKQSGVRPSQPGVKFTIPLSGYGGTGNVILEELKKRSDGYVATLGGVGAGRVSKLCVCVRNTGSRAAFIKAVPFADLQSRTVMDPGVISLSPPQFVLKERTQEVITVVLRATRREQALCQSSAALLATVCLFCGDEVSRQQFRRLLRCKPDAGRKVLSENSLLKNVQFDEPFLGEEEVLEAFDLPQRPNEAQIFYGNMNKVVLSLLGTMETSDSSESDHVDSLRPSPCHAPQSDSFPLGVLENVERHVSNVSLDVLPVKGPPLGSSEPFPKRPEPQDTWNIQPEQIVLTAPTINGVTDTKHVRILNRSNRELSFELSWPAHCLTITPQHGVIDPESHLQILISPNPSLATKSSLLPWSGQIYVQCDNQQKFVKVQIRQDLAMDVSATGPSVEKSLCPLPPQAETPTVPGLKSQSVLTKPHVEVKNRTILFPTTPSGETSECSLEVENGGEEVRWYLSSFAPPYVKGVDSSGDVYRATYTAFRCERISGALGSHEKMQVPITFLPRDRGDYAQFWDLECHPVAKPQQKSRVRFQLCGTGVRAGTASALKEGDCSLVRTEASVKTRKRVDSSGAKTGSEEGVRRGVYAPQNLYTFPATRVGQASSLKVNFRNNSFDTHELHFISPRPPFCIKHSKYSLRSQHYINLPVQFKPSVVGQHTGLLLVQTDTDTKLTIQLTAEALP
ncbi:centrosomal protein of 192 kDa [Chanos chanos]|uniref:Centrosomal protein of 192 kDa n=1 Tax=Chanos chanos TaxID=29144 RepID=A0A6J2W056_CHACN|nr:centrosomal protein of 192 kDa [Chanos chanos]